METWLKNSLEGHESPIPIGGWKGLHQTRKKKNRRLYYWFLAASVLMFAGISIWQFGDRSSAFSTENSPETKSDRYQHIDEKEKDLVEVLHPDPLISDEETQPFETTLIRPVAPIQIPVTRNPGHIQAEVPVRTNNILDAVSIRSKKTRILAGEAGRTNPALKTQNHRLQPRKRTGWTFFAEAGLANGRLQFVPGGSANKEEYRSIIEENDLTHREYSFGIGAYRQLFAHWSLGIGFQFVKGSMEGVLDYTRMEMAYDPTAASNWQDNQTLIENNFRYAPDIHSWSLRTPLRLRYQLFEGNSPLLECGGNYSYTFRSVGNWIDPVTLEPIENQKNLASTHRFSPELGFGYQWKTGPTRVAVWYRFMPGSRLYQIPGGSMEAKLHMFSIQWQMSH